MSFFGSLGGIVKSSIGTIAHQIPGVSQAYDAINAVGAIVKGGGAAGKIISTPLLSLPAPQIIAPGLPSSTTNKVALVPGTALAPMLPALPAGTGGGVVKSSGTFMTPDGQMHDKVWRQGKGHYKKNGQWSNRRRPRMNPMNVRAARRAVNRIHAAEKLFRKILSISHPGHAAGRFTPKRKKKHA